MSWKAAQACVRGSSHQRSGLPNQDAVQSTVVPGAKGALAVAVVADGHGGARHFRSQVGSALAVSLAVDTLQSFLLAHEQARTLFGAQQVEDLERKLVADWLASVHSDLRNNPFTPAEMEALDQAEGAEARSALESYPQLAYGATLLAVAATSSWILYLQLGDGEILTVGADGETTRPLPPDERLVGNQTTSLCQPEAWKDFRAVWITEGALPPMVLLSTDGYANSFRSDDDFLKIGQDYLAIVREQGIAALAEELPSILNEATQQGSGDDITLAILHDDRSPGAQEARRGAVRPALTAASKSVLMEQLKAKHSSQRRKLDQLAAKVEKTQRDNRHLRNLVLLLLVALAAVPLVIFRHRIFPQRETPTNPPSGIPGKEGKPVPRGPVTSGNGGALPLAAAGGWTLQLNQGDMISLHKGSRISSRLIHPKQKDQTYAEVAEQNGRLILINDSRDTWTITAADGARHPRKIGHGGSFDLSGAPVEIAFTPDVSGRLTALPPPRLNDGQR